MLSANAFCPCILPLTLALAAACGATPPPVAPSAPPSAPAPASQTPATEAVASGMDCAVAEARCGGGSCNVKIKNGCDRAVRCELAVTATCETQNGTSQANGQERDSFAAGSTGELGAQATCGGQVLHTEVTKLTCK
jgi:hypothetical protein